MLDLKSGRTTLFTDDERFMEVAWLRGEDVVALKKEGGKGTGTEVWIGRGVGERRYAFSFSSSSISIFVNLCLCGLAISRDLLDSSKRTFIYMYIHPWHEARLIFHLVNT